MVVSCNFYFLNWVLWPVKIILLILSRVNCKVGRKREILPEKETWPAASRTWLVSHVTRASLESSVVRWQAIKSAKD